MKSFVLSVGTFLLFLQPALTLASDGPDLDADDIAGYERSRRGWSMMRLGRGLQMLRLGKRTGPPAHLDRLQATPEQMRELLSAMIDESRNEFRRQPPLPRYGRELDEDSLDDLYTLLGEAYMSKHGYVRGDRFKRSASFQSKTSQDFPSRLRHSISAAFPSQYLNPLYNFRPSKAVPRLNEQELGNDVTDDKMASSLKANSRL